MPPVLFCHTLKCVWRSFPLTEGTQNYLRSGTGLLREVFSAYCAAPEPSERRAVKGLCKRTNFWTCKAPIWLLFFVRQWGAFLWYNFSEKADVLFAWKRCAMKGFFKCTLFMELSLFYLAFLDARLWVLFAYNFRCRGAKAYSTVGITIEWLTTIEQWEVAKYG